MATELNLRFPDPGHVIVSFDGEESGILSFTNPLTAKDHEDLRWYLEVYGAHSLGDPDDTEARRIEAQLPAWGKALFEAVFSDRASQRLFNAFQDTTEDARLLTLSAEHPAILELPWELLHDPAKGGVFLFNEHPRISIRRRVAGASGGRASFKVKSKDRLHLLFVVSRPAESGFLDPRADPAAVLDAIEAHAPGRCTWEFLRPPTLDALVERLEDESLPPVDILHFDGHGVFDLHGGLPERLADRSVHIAQALAGEVVKGGPAKTPGESPPNTGYLLFEDAQGQPDLVAADRLGLNLHQRRVPLLILSACQSAAQGDNDEPMGSVAARLTAAGIPAVLAMTHSVLVPTTRALFGEFYKQLARHRAVGEALDAARIKLYNHPKKYEVPRYDPERGAYREWLELYDWFVPALYQAGADVALLRKTKGQEPSVDDKGSARRTNLPPAPEAGFFGRRRELWDIERWFAKKTRRITLTGFGGQGKTALAQEAARWLTRTGLFRAAVFVDYSRVQAADSVAVAVNEIGSVLEQSLIDAATARKVLEETATLVVLDNLEALAPEPLRELLNAAADWSAAGESRVLLTTRTPDFGHPEYRIEGTRLHQRIVLAGLGSRQAPDDALEWFAEMFKLPPEPQVPTPAREALIELFDQVRFHPLSIRVLAQQLKVRRPAELGRRLEELLAGKGGGSPTGDAEVTLPELVASLQLSLDRLDDAARAVLPRLGIFQGGALEAGVLAISGLDKDLWPGLRRQLEAAALLEAETVPGIGVPFLRFHPTFAPMLWQQLSPDERARLTTAHRLRYYAFARYLYAHDSNKPHLTRAVALRELPNLLHAVDAAFTVHDPNAVKFAENVAQFLTSLGLTREAQRLTERMQATATDKDSHAWYLAQGRYGMQLLEGGHIAHAAGVFEAILDRLGDTPSYKRAQTLAGLGRCFALGGRPDLAMERYREGLAVVGRLEQSRWERHLAGTLHIELADMLVTLGRYAEARREYKASLEVQVEVMDMHSQGVVLGQLGTLALLEDKLDEALTKYQAVLALFQQLDNPQMEAVAWHQLGIVYRQSRQWEDAERHYREAARLKEKHRWIIGPNGAVRTWNELATVCEAAGKPEAAELWYRRALEALRVCPKRVRGAKMQSRLQLAPLSRES
ncbi:hypothetical protein BH24GEM3_BH24GEM3_16760 [soil metagenome]